MNTITIKMQADHLIMEALKEDISREDVSTNTVWTDMPESLNFWMKRPRPLFTARMAKRSKRDSFWEK